MYGNGKRNCIGIKGLTVKWLVGSQSLTNNAWSNFRRASQKEQQLDRISYKTSTSFISSNQLSFYLHNYPVVARAEAGREAGSRKSKRK